MDSICESLGYTTLFDSFKEDLELLGTLPGGNKVLQMVPVFFFEGRTSSQSDH